MKTKMTQFLLGLLLAMTLVGCKGKAEGTGKTIEPLPSTLNINELDNCMIYVGIDAAGVSLNDDGTLAITMKVYDYELFDMVDISTMKIGDILKINGTEMPVTSIEDGEYFITINEGLEMGGCYLKTDDDGVYYEVLMDAAKSFHELGEVTIPVGSDFTFVDQSDLNGPEQTYDTDEFINYIKNTDVILDPYNTTVRIADGKIVEGTKVYTP